MHKNMDFMTMEISEVMAFLKSDADNGLSGEEAENRILKYGYNEVPEKKTPAILIFLRKFWGLNAWLLEFIILTSYLLSNYTDFYIVTFLLVLNAVLGFVQEYQASRAVEALKKKLQVNARVLRDGQWAAIPARGLVSGDIVRVRTGDFVSADIKIIKGGLWLDQSALNGESLEAEKKPGDVAYSGSVVTRSEATGIVVLTGSDTYFGRTVSLVQIARPKLHIEGVISEIIRSLFIAIMLMLCLALAISYYRGANLLQLLPLFLVLLLTVVPVALPTMFTITLALGSSRLAGKNVLITRLNALDDAASMDILCADKTGTLTMNRMSVASIIPLSAFEKEEVLLYCALASKEANKDPIDSAFLEAAKNLQSASFRRKKFIPFDPAKRRTEAILLYKDEEIHVMKGAFDIIAQLCRIDGAEAKRLEGIVHDFALKGNKTIAVSVSRGGQNILAGLVALQDTPREDSHTLIKDLKGLGISIKMLTGDALPIAREIARQIGLGKNIIRATDFKKLVQESPEKAAAIAEKADGFAEIYPEDKYIIVKNLQSRGHIVGMTGDGINDSIALKQAEVGIATSNATDVAKGASSIVLTKEGLPNIAEPVKIGRMMFQIINTWILQKIVWTVLMSSIVVISLILTGKSILSSSAALLMLLLTDFGKVSLSTDNVRWSNEPEKRRIRDLAKAGIALSLVVLAEALLLLYLGSGFFGIFSDRQALSTFTFEILFCFATFTIIIVREKGHFWESMPSKFLSGALIFDSSAAILLSSVGALGLKALPITETLAVFLYTLFCTLVINDRAKIFLLDKMGLR